MSRLILRILLFLVGATMLLDALEAVTFREDVVFTANKVLTAALLAYAPIFWLLHGGGPPRNGKSPWLAVFFLSLVVSSIYAVAQGSSGIGMAMRWTTFIAMFLFYFLLCYVLRTRRDLDIFLVSLLVSGAIASISAFLLEGRGGWWGPERRSGIGSGENQAAGNLLMILPFVLALGYKVRSLTLRLLLLGLGILYVMGFVLTLSRSGFLAAIVVGGFLLIKTRRLSDFRVIAVSALFIAVAFAAAPSDYAARLSSLTRFATGAKTTYTDEIDYRANIYRAGVIAFIQNPIIGVGTDRFQTWAGQRDPRMIGTHEVHNAVLQVAGNHGLLGLIPYSALLLLTFFDFSRAQALCRRLRHRNDDELDKLYVRAVMIQAGFLGILTVAMFQPGTFWRGIWACFALSTAVLALVRQRVAVLEGAPSTQLPDAFSLTPGFPQTSATESRTF